VSRREDQGRFIVIVPDEVTPGRPVNYLNVNINGGTNVVLDFGFVQPFLPGMQKPEAVITFRGGTNVDFLRMLHKTTTELLAKLDELTQQGPPPPLPAAGGQITN